jgi:predicted dehydrogenase
MPAFMKCGVRLKTVVSSSGVSGVQAGRKFGFEETTTTTEPVFSDPDTEVVVIATRHDSHASLVSRALAAGKHVFVEKPLALDAGGLAEIEAAYSDAATRGRAPLLMVGFNRRFAPHVQRMKSLLAGVREPKVFVMTVNAGAIPAAHWTQDPVVGGGRIIGEGCHFIDLLRFLAGAPIAEVQATAMGRGAGVAVPEDKVSFTLKFTNGSFGTVHYLANGDRSFPKERLEVFCAGRILQLDNFRKLRAYGWRGFAGMGLWRQDKGNRACVAAFVSAVRSGGASPIAFEELVETTQVSFRIAELIRG